MNWTKLFDQHLEKILPIRHLVREPGIPIEFGSGYRNWHADYTFSLSGSPFVVEVKLHRDDTPLSGTKVMAYQKLYNIHAGRTHSALIVSRKSNTNSADLLACAILKISLLVIDFTEQADKSILFNGKLDGSLTYQAILGRPTGNTPLESKIKGLASDSEATAEVSLLTLYGPGVSKLHFGPF